MALKIDPETAKQLGTNIMGLSQDFGTNLSSLRTLITNNVGSDKVWQDQAATNFKDKFEQYASAFDDFETLMRNNGQLVYDDAVAAETFTQQHMSNA